METFYSLENVSTNYGSMLQSDKFFTKIYVVTSAFDENWNITGAVSVFDVAAKSFDDNPFVSDVSGISGISVNPINNDVYIFSAESTVGIGMMDIYDLEGNYLKNYEVGASPNGAIFLD